MQSRPPEIECNFTRCPQHPQARRMPWLPKETHWPMCARADTAASDPYPSPSAPDPFDTLPGFHTLRHPFRNPGQHKRPGPLACWFSPLPPSPTTPAGPSSPNPRESLGDPAAPPSSAPPGTQAQRGPAAPPAGPSLSRLCQHPRISRPLVIIPPTLCLPTQAV